MDNILETKAHLADEICRLNKRIEELERSEIELIRAKEKLKLDEQRLKALLGLSHLVNADLKEITDYALEQGVQLTRSQIGYLAFTNDDETVLTMHSWSQSAMAVCAIEQKPIVYLVKNTGLWGEAIRQRQPVITNDYLSPNPLKKGYPDGHVYVSRHMNIPIFDDNRIVAVAGVGNKEEDYDEMDVFELTLLMQGMWQLLQRKHTAEAIRKANRYNRNLIEVSLDPLVTIGPTGTITDVNRATEEVTGRSRQELIGSDFCSYFTEPQDAQASYKQVFEQGFVRDYPLEIQHRLGQVIPVLYNASVYRDEDGEVTGVFAAARDISERKRSEDALRRKEVLQAAILDGMIQFIGLLDITGHIIRINRAARESLGLSEEELLGKYFWETIWWKNSAQSQERIKQAIIEAANGTFVCFETEVHTSTGSMTIDLSLNPVKDETGKVRLIVAEGRDISQRKRMEEQLRNEKNRAERYLNLPSTVIVALNTVGEITMINQAGQRFLGYTEQELIGKNWFELTVPESIRANILDVFHLIISGHLDPVEHYENEIMNRQGDVFVVEWHNSLIFDEHSRIIGTLSAGNDITERKRAEQALKKTMNDLERSNNELQQFAYVASHDLQEPLRMVSSYTQLLAQRYGQTLDRDAHEFIAFAVDGATRMQKLIQDLLALSRITTHGREFMRIDTVAALQYAITNLQYSIEETKAEITFDPLPVLNADGTQLCQLFQNLIGNAIKFRKPNEVARIHIGAEKKSEEWLFTVKDDGIGIDPKYFERIFVIFQRLHTIKEYSGSGIGLAICKRIVERHGGRIWVESKLGEGTAFYFTFPDHVNSSD